MSKVSLFTKDGHLRCTDGRNDEYRFDRPCKRIATVKVRLGGAVYIFLCEYHVRLYSYDESSVLLRSPKGFKQKYAKGRSVGLVPYDEK